VQKVKHLQIIRALSINSDIKQTRNPAATARQYWRASTLLSGASNPGYIHQAQYFGREPHRFGGDVYILQQGNSIRGGQSLSIDEGRFITALPKLLGGLMLLWIADPNSSHRQHQYLPNHHQPLRNFPKIAIFNYSFNSGYKIHNSLLPYLEPGKGS